MAGDWNTLGDPSQFQGLPFPASPISGAGEDPDEVRERMMAQMAQGAHAGTAMGPMSSTAGPQAPPQQAPSGPGHPDIEPPGFNADIARQSMTGSLSSSQKQMATADQMQPDPQIAALEQKKMQDEAAAPDASNYKPGFGTRLLRGLKGAGLGLAEGGIFGMGVGAIDPGLVRGGTSYGDPTDAYDTALSKNKAQVGQDTESLSNAQANFKQAQELREQQLGGYKDAGEAFKGAGTTATEEQKQELGQQKNLSQLREHGLTLDEQGNISALPYEQLDPAQQATVDAKNASAELAKARADLAKEQADPNSPAYKLAMARVQTAQQNASAAIVRANAYALNAYGANKGTDPDGNPLRGATEVPGGPDGAGGTVGSHFQSTVQNQQGRVAQFNDVLQATTNLESTARQLVKTYGPSALSSPLVAAAMAQPPGTFEQWLQGQVAAGRLSPAQRDYVTNLRAFRENLQALRKSAGGGVSDAQVQRLMEMAPGPGTPDLDYLLRQTGQIRSTAQRLSKGIPNIVGGYQVEGGDAPAPAAGGSGSAAPDNSWIKQFPKAN